MSLREIWPDEARGFTAWLADNLGFLSETLDLELSLVQREAAVGPFQADILAEDSTGNTVIIENQLEPTDHDHLGKLLTYLSNLGAKVGVWISSAPRPEHETAIHWLNEMLPADTAFYLLGLEAYKIGESDPAPSLTVVAGPSAVGKQIGREKKELADRHALRRMFWTQLLEQAKRVSGLHANVSPGKENWVSAGAGMSGLTFAYIIRMGDAQVELYIDRGDVDVNKRIFDRLAAHRAQVEAAFRGPLDWQRLDESRASRIRYVIPGGGLRDEERWPEIQKAMVEAMVRLERALRPEIERLRDHSGSPSVV